MEEAIHRATENDATISSVLGSTVPSGLPKPTSAEIQMMFSLLLPTSNAETAAINPSGVASLMILSATYFTLVPQTASEQECENYCRCFSAQSAIFTDFQHFHIGMSEIFTAIGYAVTRVTRSSISKTGIIPALKSYVLSVSEYENGRYELTSVHPEFMQACIAAGHYRYAADFADRYPVFTVNHKLSSLSAEQFLRYFFLLGNVYCGCNRWSDGIKCYNICLTVPSQAVSSITVAAYKKLLFASLLSKSKKPTIPPGTSIPVSRFISTANEKGVKEYNELADAFCANDIGKYRMRMNNMSKRLHSDGNFGLANILLESIRPNMVKNIANIYEVISLSKLSGKLGFDSNEETEALIIQMVANGQCHAKVDQELSSVHFELKEELENIDDDIVLMKIIEQTRSCMELAERVRDLDIALSTSTKYQSKLFNKGKPNNQVHTGGDGAGDGDVFMQEDRSDDVA